MRLRSVAAAGYMRLIVSGLEDVGEQFAAPICGDTSKWRRIPLIALLEQASFSCPYRKAQYSQNI